jgi:hypothetical protein
VVVGHGFDPATIPSRSNFDRPRPSSAATIVPVNIVTDR